jgi:hypothetical protein
VECWLKWSCFSVCSSLLHWNKISLICP